jgi:hypothetical protein|nr:MAG TPA: hypothetical protein [Caudoviricetes sp.]
MIEEITWDTFDERTRIWMRVLAQVPSEAVVRMLRLDLNTGVVTLMGVGGDRVLGVIGEGDAGEEFFTPLRSWSRDLDPYPIPYTHEYVGNIALAVFHSALNVLVGDLPLVWDDYFGLSWVSDNMNELLDVNTTDLREYRDQIRSEAAECWVGDFATDLDNDIPLRVTKESTPNMIRYLTGGHGSVEIVIAPDDEGLIDVNILDPKGRGPCFHLAWGSEAVQEAHERAVLFLNNVIEKNKRKESHVS